MFLKIALLFFLMTITLLMLVQIAGLMFDHTDAAERLRRTGDSDPF